MSQAVQDLALTITTEAESKILYQSQARQLVWWSG